MLYHKKENNQNTNN